MEGRECIEATRERFARSSGTWAIGFVNSDSSAAQRTDLGRMRGSNTLPD